MSSQLAAPPSSMPGAIPTSTSVATGISREAGDTTLTVEHRAAPAMPSVTLELAQRANALAFEVSEQRTPQTAAPSSVDERITAVLTDVEHRRAACALPRLYRDPLRASRRPHRRRPPQQVRSRLLPRPSLTVQTRQSNREHAAIGTTPAARSARMAAKILS
jgi:hypothetical protein